MAESGSPISPILIIGIVLFIINPISGIIQRGPYPWISRVAWIFMGIGILHSIYINVT